MTKSNQVAYKPLNTAPDNDPDQFDDPDDDHDKLVLGPLDRATSSPSSSSPYKSSRQFVSLRQLRCLLYMIATLLLLIFIVRLTTYRDDSRLELPRIGDIRSPSEAHHILRSVEVPDGAGHKQIVDTRPVYDNYMLSILKEKQQKSWSSDDLQNEPSPRQQDNNNINKKIWWTAGSRLSDRYVTISNYIRAMKSFNFNASITLTTQATSEFMYHTLELCKRWDGPISVAVYCPGPELQVAITLIKYMRQCLPAPLSGCIRDKVTWHLVYDRIHGPPSSEINYPRSRLDSANYPLFVNAETCPKLAGPETIDLIQQFEAQLKKVNKISPPNTYRKQFHLTYPINVLRNTARLAANTRHILASDIELYPSLNLVPQFIKFIGGHNMALEYPTVKKFVFTLPIFEVKANVSAPKTKPELIKMIERGDAIFFHKWVCDACQNFPHRQEWLERNIYNETRTVADSLDEVVIFEVTQRDKSRDSWEPIFIGTNDEPQYDDRLTWDGRRDKMGQMYEMCLQDYHLFVLGNAFLTHSPGIKHLNRDDFTKRADYIRQNNAHYDETISTLKKQYANSANIKRC